MPDHRHDVQVERLQPIEDRGHRVVAAGEDRPHRHDDPRAPSRPTEATTADRRLRDLVRRGGSGGSPPASGRPGRAVPAAASSGSRTGATAPARDPPAGRGPPAAGSGAPRTAGTACRARPSPGARRTGRRARPPRSTSPARCPRARRGRAATIGPGPGQLPPWPRRGCPRTPASRSPPPGGDRSARPAPGPGRTRTAGPGDPRRRGPAPASRTAAARLAPPDDDHVVARVARGLGERHERQEMAERRVGREGDPHPRTATPRTSARDGQSRSSVRSAALTRSSRPAPDGRVLEGQPRCLAGLAQRVAEGLERRDDLALRRRRHRGATCPPRCRPRTPSP